MSRAFWPEDLRPEPRPRLDPDVIYDPDTRDEWRHFAAYGWPDEQIAERLGLNLATLRKYESARKKRPA